jgi:hypothetical protein
MPSGTDLALRIRGQRDHVAVQKGAAQAQPRSMTNKAKQSAAPVQHGEVGSALFAFDAVQPGRADVIGIQLHRRER